MNEKSLLLLILLNIAHWAADYTHLSRPYMLQAKKLGTPFLPIFEHACVHYFLMAFVLIFFCSNPIYWVLICQIELFTHCGIDVLKGKLNYWFPSLQSPANVFHWYVFGVDQFMHQAVIVLITYLALR
jgi:hypothetical protein